MQRNDRDEALIAQVLHDVRSPWSTIIPEAASTLLDKSTGKKDIAQATLSCRLTLGAIERRLGRLHIALGRGE